MLRALLQISGIERLLLAFKLRIEARAERLIRHGKAVAMRIAIATALAAVAIAILFLALAAGLAALYFALAPHLGSVGAAGVVAGILLVLAAVLALAAVTIARQKIADPPAPATAPPGSGATGPAATDAATADAAAARTAAAAAEMRNSAEPIFPTAAPVTAGEIEALMALTRRYAHVPEVGVEPLDAFLKGITPRAEEAGRDALARAAALVRTGDRATMLIILGAAAAAGWALTRVHGPGATTAS